MIAGEPSISAQSGRMVYVSGEYETKIYKMPFGAHADGNAEAVVEGLGDHRDLAVSPDGSRIAFSSNRTGAKELWFANEDGSNQTQITSFGGPAVGSPRWSPDGKQLAFDGYAGGSSDIYITPVDGGKPRRLTSDPSNEIRPEWSHDGQWIYFGSDRGGQGMQVWKIPIAGGEPVQVTRNGGQAAFETPGREWLFVVRSPELLRMRLDGSQETVLHKNVYTNFATISATHIYVLDGLKLLRAPFDAPTFETAREFNPRNAPIGGGTCIGLPGDERYLLYRRNTHTITNLVLVENFKE
jgi:Tol biopolymer transport system component